MKYTTVTQIFGRFLLLLLVLTALTTLAFAGYGDQHHSEVPEPTTVLMLGGGLVALGIMHRRNRRNRQGKEGERMKE